MGLKRSHAQTVYLAAQAEFASRDDFKAGNPDAISLYRGEYMIQYPWAAFKD